MRFPFQAHVYIYIYIPSSKLRTRGTIPAMALKIKTLFIVLLLVFISSSSDLVEGFRESMHPTHHLLHKDGMEMNWRKLLSHEYVLDYDEAGANPKHAKKPGKGT